MEYIYTKYVLFNLKCIFNKVVYFYLLTPETLTAVNMARGSGTPVTVGEWLGPKTGPHKRMRLHGFLHWSLQRGRI